MLQKSVARCRNVTKICGTIRGANPVAHLWRTHGAIRGVGYLNPLPLNPPPPPPHWCTGAAAK